MLSRPEEEKRPGQEGGFDHATDQRWSAAPRCSWSDGVESLPEEQSSEQRACKVVRDTGQNTDHTPLLAQPIKAQVCRRLGSSQQAWLPGCTATVGRSGSTSLASTRHTRSTHQKHVGRDLSSAQTQLEICNIGCSVSLTRRPRQEPRSFVTTCLGTGCILPASSV